MRKFLATLACLLPLTMAACGDDASPDDGNGGDGGAGTGSFTAAINARPPVPGILGTYYLDDEEIPGCDNKATCTFTVDAARVYTLNAWFPDLIAVQPKNFEISHDREVANVSWGPGEWSLAPNGTYERDTPEGPEVIYLETQVEDGQIVLHGLFGIPAVVTGNTYHGENRLGTIDGTISDDVSEVIYHRVAANVFDGILRRQ